MGLVEKESKSGKRGIIIIIVLIALLILIIVGIVAIYIIFEKTPYTEPTAIKTTTTTTTQKIITFVRATTSTITTTTTTTTTTTKSTTTTLIIVKVNASCYKDSDCGMPRNLSTCSDDRSEAIKEYIQPMCMNPSTEGAYCWNRTTIAEIIPCTDVRTDSEGNIIRQSRCFAGGCTKV